MVPPEFDFQRDFKSINLSNFSPPKNPSTGASDLDYVQTVNQALFNSRVVFNDGATPSIKSDVLARRPSPGIIGRLFLATDTYELFRDLGNTWYPLTRRQSVYVHTQGLASTIWTVTHNFGNKNLIFFVYDSNDQLVTAQISNVTDNSFDVNLTNAITGRVVVFGGTDQFVNAIQASSITVGTVQITGTGIIVNGIDIIAQLNTKANKNGDSTQDFSVKQLSVAGNIVPAADVTYDLGTPTNRFKDLYLSGSTIFIGGGSISFNSTTNKFSFFDDSGSTPAVLSLDQNTTDDLAEGTTNLYHTASRVIGVVNTLKGQAGGLAPLNASARIDSTYLPEYLTGSLEGSVSGSSGTLIDDAFPTTAARSAEFLVQVTQGTKHEVLKLLVLHDGTAAMVTEYGRVSTAATDVSFDATISGGNVTLTAQLGTAASTVIKFKRMAIAP